MEGINPFLMLTLAVGVSMIVIPLLMRAAPRLGLIDVPDPRKVHANPVPRVGGWGIVIGGLVPPMLSFELGPLLQSYIAGAAILFVFGVWDDARDLGHWTKFVGQSLAACVVVFYGDLYVTRLPFLEPDALSPIAGRLFTVFALVGAINALNHSDGLDGLAGGESLLTLIAVAVLSYVAGDGLALGIALSMIGGILGFLRYNSHPARVFMGDSGSQALGFTLAFLVVYLTQVTHTASSPALALLLLGLPIADILAVLWQRIHSGGHWFKASRNHIHHRLLQLGFEHHETVIIIYSIHAALVVCGVVMRYEADWAVLGVYAAIVGVVFASVTRAERNGWRLRRERPPSIDDTAVGRLLGRPLLRRAPLWLISAVVPAFMLFTSLWVARVPADFAIVAGLLACIVVADMLLTRTARSIGARAAIYAAAIFSAYLLIFYPGAAGTPVRAAAVCVIGLLAAAIAVYVRLSARKEFGTTPTDYLMAFGTLALIAFGLADVGSRTIVELVAYAIVLLYGCEIALDRAAVRRWPLLHVSTVATLTILAFRGAL
jgi:UDP-GlcNAc:undecaprenyl-phosphate GlcNAc-1-phosphate transferase